MRSHRFSLSTLLAALAVTALLLLPARQIEGVWVVPVLAAVTAVVAFLVFAVTYGVLRTLSMFR